MKNISYQTMKDIVDGIEYLNGLSPLSFEDVEKIVDVYNEGDDYCDFTYKAGADLIIEGSFYKGESGEIVLSPSFSIFDEEANRIMDIF